MAVDALQTTLQKTHLWLHQIDADLQAHDEQVAYHALRAVLHALRDRLSIDDAAALAAQLPLLVRGIFFEGWHPHGKPLPLRKADEFLELIDQYLAQDREFGIPSRRVLDAVLGAMRVHVDTGAFDQLLRAMPEHIQALFTPTRSESPATQ